MTAIYHAKVFGRITMLKVWYLMQLGDGIDQDDKLGEVDDDVQLVAVAALTKEDNEGHPAIR